jgi:hypothetical protein
MDSSFLELDPEGEGIMLPHNAGNYVPVDVAKCAKTLISINTVVRT